MLLKERVAHFYFIFIFCVKIHRQKVGYATFLNLVFDFDFGFFFGRQTEAKIDLLRQQKLKK